MVRNFDSLGMLSPLSNMLGRFLLTLPSFSSDSLDTGTVQVIVGQEKKIFTMHKGVLCSIAPFFRAAFEGQFVEGTEQVLRLPEDDPNLFRYFQLWAYTKNFLEDGEILDTVEYKVLMDLHIFGDKYGVQDLQNAAIDVLIDKANATKMYPISLFDHVYRNTASDSRLRQLCVDWTLWRLDYMDISEGSRRDRFPKEFLFDLALANHELTKSFKGQLVFDFASKRSDYHVKSL